MTLWPTTTVADPVGAVVLHLRDALPQLGGRVWADRVPGAEAGTEPRSGVLLRRSGGPGGPAHLPLVVVRLDVHCYGASPGEAVSEHLLVHGALNDVLRVVRAGVLLHHLRAETGPMAQTDPDTERPEVVSVWQLTASEALD